MWFPFNQGSTSETHQPRQFKCDKESVGRALLRFRKGGENPASGLDNKGDFGAGFGLDIRIERVSAGRKGQDCTRQDRGDPGQARGRESPAVLVAVWHGWNLSISKWEIRSAGSAPWCKPPSCVPGSREKLGTSLPASCLSASQSVSCPALTAFLSLCWYSETCPSVL